MGLNRERAASDRARLFIVKSNCSVTLQAASPSACTTHSPAKARNGPSTSSMVTLCGGCRWLRVVKL